MGVNWVLITLLLTVADPFTSGSTILVHATPSLDAPARTNCQEDMVTSITELQQSVLTLQEQNQHLQNITDKLLKEMLDMRHKDQLKDSIIQDLHDKTETLTRQNQNLSERIGNVKSQNVQYGSHYGCTTFDNLVTFSSPFANQPTVFLSVRQWFHYHTGTGSSYDSGFHVSANAVTNTGFNLNCFVQNMYNTFDIHVDWLAIDL